jgi:hypothetical protein
MAKIIIDNPDPPFAEIDEAISRTGRMISRLRGRDAITLAKLAASKAQLENARKDLWAAHERTQRSLTGGCDAKSVGRSKGPARIVSARQAVRPEQSQSAAVGGAAVQTKAETSAATAGREVDAVAFHGGPTLARKPDPMLSGRTGGGD